MYTSLTSLYKTFVSKELLSPNVKSKYTIAQKSYKLLAGKRSRLFSTKYYTAQDTNV
jgi:hypothetical protein